VLGLSVEELEQLAIKLAARHLAEAPLEQVIQYVAEDRSFVEEAWARLKPAVRKRVREVVKLLPRDRVEKLLSPEVVGRVLARSGRLDIASLFVNDPRARGWLKRELERAKALLLGTGG